MNIWSSLTSLRQGLAPLRARPIALVPTMGNLHQGHLALVRQAQTHAPNGVVVSIFVNPLQFGPQEDFARYPRTFDQDCTQLRALNVQGVFAPSAELLYPQGLEAHSKVIVPQLGEQLCGAFRPQLFTGVTTVVNMLFHLVQPEVAVFGEKDWQQLVIVRKMVADLAMPVRIEGGSTVREADGLAMSSRNQYLSAEQRALAPLLYEQLQRIAQGVRTQPQQANRLCQQASDTLHAAGFKVDYCTVRQADTLTHPVDNRTTPLRVLAAAWLGQTRLIDNLAV